MRLSLQADELWSYVVDGPTDLSTPWPAFYPPPRPASKRAADIAHYKKFYAQDAKVKLLIMRRCSATIRALLPDDTTCTARDWWKHLDNLFLSYARKSGSDLHEWMRDTTLADPADYLEYVAEFSSILALSKRIGAGFAEADIANRMLDNLPFDMQPVAGNIRTRLLYNDRVSRSANPGYITEPITFAKVSELIIEHCRFVTRKN